MANKKYVNLSARTTYCRNWQTSRIAWAKEVDAEAVEKFDAHNREKAGKN